MNDLCDGRFFHPRFGEIKCIRTTRAVCADEEIFVDYTYKEGTGPQWFRKALKQHRDRSTITNTNFN